MFIILYVLHCQHIPCVDPFLGCNVSCYRLFRRRVRCLRSWSYTQWCRWSWWTHLSSKPSAVIVLDGLKPYLSYLFLFWDIVVISAWLLLCYKSIRVLCVSALPIQGWHWCTEITLFKVWSLQTAPPPTVQEKPHPRLLNSIQYTNFVSMDWAMEESL